MAERWEWFVACRIVRWVSDDPQPGIVEGHITDADGALHRFVDKQAMFIVGILGPMSDYPVEALLPIDEPSDKEVVEVRVPWVEDENGESLLRMRRDALVSRPAPPIQTDPLPSV